MTGASGLRPHHHTSAGDGGTITALSNPMTTLDDLIVGGASGTPARLGKGTDGQALIVDPVTHHLAWGTASAALTDHTHAATGSGATGGGASLSPTTLIIPGSTSPAQTADGSAVWDTDDDVLTVGTGATRKTFGYFGNTAPSGLGTASAGSGNEAARLSHIHGMPRLDELGAPTADISLNTHKVTNVTNPASPQDAATKAYVDGAITGAGGLSDHGIVTYLDYQVGAAPATPASGYVRHYAKTGGHIAQKDDAGAETLLDTGGSSLTVQDEGSSLATAATTINFTGAGVTASGTGATKTVNIPGSSGGVDVPRVVQIKTAGTAATSITLDSAPASGHSVILATNATNTGLVSSVSSTNTTWTRVASRSSASVFYEVWIGVVAGGAGGTAITITHSNSFLSCTAVEVVDTLTATAGLTANGATSATIAATTSGHLIVAMTSNANTTVVASVDMTILRLGLSSAIVPLVVGYSRGDAISVVGTATSGTVVAEVT